MTAKLIPLAGDDLPFALRPLLIRADRQRVRMLWLVLMCISLIARAYQANILPLLMLTITGMLCLALQRRPEYPFNNLERAKNIWSRMHCAVSKQVKRAANDLRGNCQH